MTERNGSLCSVVSPVLVVDLSAVFGGDVGHDGVFELQAILQQGSMFEVFLSCL